MAALRVGIDVGGTFTDLVAWDETTGEMRACKVPSVPADPAEGVVAGLEVLVRDQRCASIAHGTTIVTNAIVERRGAPTALVTTRGFRDVLEIARMNRAHLYRIDLAPKDEPLVPRHLRLEVTERVGKYEQPDATCYGVVAILRNGPGPTVLLRSDMDVLPVAEQTGLPYASQNAGVE